MRFTILAGFLMLAALPLQAAQQAREQVTDFTLDNGMQVVVIEDHFGVRLTSLISPEERIRSLGRGEGK